MPALSLYAKNKLLDHLLGKTAYTMPTNLHVALFTSNPTDQGTGTEVSGNAYARQPVTFGAAVNGTSANNVDVVFPIATGSWGTITHIGVYDASTGGNMLFYGALTTSKTIGVDDQFKIASGNLTLSLS